MEGLLPELKRALKDRKNKPLPKKLPPPKKAPESIAVQGAELHDLRVEQPHTIDVAYRVDRCIRIALDTWMPMLTLTAFGVSYQIEYDLVSDSIKIRGCGGQNLSPELVVFPEVTNVVRVRNLMMPIRDVEREIEVKEAELRDLRRKQKAKA